MNSGRECRICMIDSQEEDEELIQPCRCTTAFVHESCLQKWRDENIDNDRYNKFVRRLILFIDNSQKKHLKLISSQPLFGLPFGFIW